MIHTYISINIQQYSIIASDVSWYRTRWSSKRNSNWF